MTQTMLSVKVGGDDILECTDANSPPDRATEICLTRNEHQRNNMLSVGRLDDLA